VKSDHQTRDEAIESYIARREFQTDPYTFYSDLRTRRPFYKFNGNNWLISGHANVASILTDPRFAYADGPVSGAAAGIEDWESLVTNPSDNLVARTRRKCAHLMRLGIFGRNPPYHTRLRSLLFRASFTREKLAALALRVQVMADRMLEKLEGASKIDIIADYADPLTAQVITQAIGVPPDLPAMRRWSRDLSGSLTVDPTPIERERGLLAMAGLAEYLRKTVPGQDHDSKGMLGFLWEASANGQISRDEVLANCAVVLVAGHITTQHLIGNGTYLLLKHPAQQQLLRDNPALISGAVEEILRYEAPLQRVKRIAQTDVAIGGETIRKGQAVFLLLGSANRDPELCADPDRFDITRDPVQHLSFAFGLHFCIGAALARMEAGIALASLLRHFPRLRLESDEARWEKRSLFRGLEALPVLTD